MMLPSAQGSSTADCQCGAFCLTWFVVIQPFGKPLAAWGNTHKGVGFLNWDSQKLARAGGAC